MKLSDKQQEELKREWFEKNKLNIKNEAQRLLDKHNKELIKKHALLDENAIDEEQTKKLKLVRINPFNPFSGFKVWNHLLKKDDIILVKMQKKNGLYDLFYKYPNKNRFIYRKGSYLLDDSMREWVKSLQCYMFCYHEGCSLPYRHSIDINTVQKKFKEEEVNVRTALNPLALTEYLNSDVVKTAVAGSDAFIKQILIIVLIIINLLFSVILLIMLFFK